MQLSQIPVLAAHSGSCARRARAVSAVAVPCGLKPLQLSSRSSQAARGDVAVPQKKNVRRCQARAATRTVAPTSAGLGDIFKQNKDSLQWVTIFCTFGAIMAVAAPMARSRHHSETTLTFWCTISTITVEMRDSRLPICSDRPSPRRPPSAWSRPSRLGCRVYGCSWRCAPDLHICGGASVCLQQTCAHVARSFPVLPKQKRWWVTGSASASSPSRERRRRGWRSRGKSLVLCAAHLRSAPVPAR